MRIEETMMKYLDEKRTGDESDFSGRIESWKENLANMKSRKAGLAARTAKRVSGILLFLLLLSLSLHVEVSVCKAQGVTKEQIAPFRVQAGSPAIKGGANLWKELGCDTKPENCKDIAGTPLPKEGAWPIGAVMYVPVPQKPIMEVSK